MKKQTIIRIIGALVLILFIASGLGLDFGLFCDGGFATLATAAVVGIPTEGTVSVSEMDDAGIAEEDIDQAITRISPNKTPLDTITRKMRSASQAKSQEVKFYQVSTKPFTDTIDTSASGTGLSGSPCKSYTYASGAGVASIFVAVNSAELWRVDDTLLMRNLTLPGTVDNAVVAVVTNAASKFKYDVMFYVKSKSANVLELVPIGGIKGTGINSAKNVVPDFSDTTLLVRMGQAKRETALRTDPIAILPVPKSNYCQNFITQVEESTFSMLTKKEIDYGIADFDRENLESMRGEMENSFLFGQKGKIDGSNGDNIYFTGGISREITKTVEYGIGGGDRSMTAEMYMSMLQEVFVGNNGSPERVMFAGSNLIKSFELLRETQKNISGTTSQETYHGVIVTKIISTFGTIRLAHNPLFDEIGMEDEGLILDMSHIYRRAFVPMKAAEIDFISNGEKNAKGKTVQECSCLILKYPDCHAWVRPKA